MTRSPALRALSILSLCSAIFTSSAAFQRPLVSNSYSHNKRTSTSTSSSISTLQSQSTQIYDADRASQEQRLQERLQPTNIKNVKDDPEWKFFDTARLHVQAGDGGNGCVAFRREKGEARGGPNGGRGGHGGNIILVGDARLNTLAHLRQRVHVKATKGNNGTGKNRDGSIGNDILVPVPLGTIVRDLRTQEYAGELKNEGDTLFVARGGRGGRGNAAFMTARRTAPKLAERGEPGAARWLSIELRLVADVGFLGMPNAGKSTLLAAASAARPKIADYPFTTIVPNLGVCNVVNEQTGVGLVLCDIPGLIKGASQGSGMGDAFLRHVQRCRVLLHVVDGSSEDPLQDFETINQELLAYDQFLAQKPQVVVINKIDIPQVQERLPQLIEQIKQAAGHSRVLPIAAATTQNVKELMTRLHKFVDAQPPVDDLPSAPAQVDWTKAGLDHDSDDYEIISDPSYPGQWRVKGPYIEQIAKMTHWEYPEAVSRFGRQLEALGIATALSKLGAEDGDLIMIDEYDFNFAPSMTNVYIPTELLEREAMGNGGKHDDNNNDDILSWRPFTEGGYMDVDTDEFMGFNADAGWDMLEDDDQVEDGDDVWMS